MRALIAFVVAFAVSLALLVWLSEELRVLPRGPGWLVLCFLLAGVSARFFGKGGRAEQVGSVVAAAVTEKVGGFSAPGADEEAIWALAASEFDSHQRRTGLYAKALVAASGNEGKAKANYLKARVAELTANADGRQVEGRR